MYGITILMSLCVANKKKEELMLNQKLTAGVYKGGSTPLKANSQGISDSGSVCVEIYIHT